MAAKKKARLGRGLGVLLGDVKATTGEGTVAAATVKAPNEAANPGGLMELSIEQLQRGEYQPRAHMNQQALQELAESIKAQGVIQPLLVRPAGRNRYEIIAGERRWRGAQLAGLERVPVVVRDIPDQTAMAVGLIENIQRENLNAIEEARGYRRLLEEFGLTHQEVSEVVGCSRAAVTNTLRLLSLHPVVQEMVQSDSLSMGHARAILGAAETQQPELARRVMAGSLSVRHTERLVKSGGKGAPPSGDSAQDTKSADIRRLEDDLSQRIGAPVDIRHRPKKGKLVITYHSLDELDGILARIK